MKFTKKIMLLSASISAQTYATIPQDINLDASEIPLHIKTDSSNFSLFNSPITTFNDTTYVSFVKPNGRNHETIIGTIKKNEEKKFITVEGNNLNDPYHAQPSLAVDPHGYIHITFNMHSSPWQYSVSSKPENIDSWIFKGENLNGRHDSLESTKVYGPGAAAIPGNRITYSYFAYDNSGDIHICFREMEFNVPQKEYRDDNMSLGVASYNAETRRWSRVGNSKSPLATSAGFQAQGCRIYFSKSSNMYISWTWYVSYFNDGHNKKNNVSLIYSDDKGSSFKNIYGTRLQLPLNIDSSTFVAKEDYFSGYTRISEGPTVLLLPKPNASIRRSTLSFQEGHWSLPSPIPYGGTELLYDQSRKLLIAVSSGLELHFSDNNGKTWQTVKPVASSHKYYIWPDQRYTQTGRGIKLLTQDISTGNLSVFTFNFKNFPTLPVLPLSPEKFTVK